ncbi:uncharacterized protein EDB93DRAFT_1106827 [Suillus bovinus]|uniref:uncharacterized protein n=1 Tax=Suillus bovinus TaxID=48563 RepID=UPI001B886308|nr:uncharacterized protein EDB93DRAFT_1106827 [Suillus bovinus]KAG2136473.1 hypothetical protein EDB93DRAFT_1106827 [Suillus bovinus]
MFESCVAHHLQNEDVSVNPQAMLIQVFARRSQGLEPMALSTVRKIHADPRRCPSFAVAQAMLIQVVARRSQPSMQVKSLLSGKTQSTCDAKQAAEIPTWHEPRIPLLCHDLKVATCTNTDSYFCLSNNMVKAKKLMEQHAYIYALSFDPLTNIFINSQMMMLRQ